MSWPVRRLLRWLTAVVLTAAAAGAGGGLAQASTGAGYRILPPDRPVAGRTYADYSAVFWQWAYSLPATNPRTGEKNPLLDDGRVDCSYGQSGTVWFLPGTFLVTGANGHFFGRADRTCSLPVGRVLFIPILNAEFDQYTNPPGSPHLGIPGLRRRAAQAVDTRWQLSASIDGNRVQNLPTAPCSSPCGRHDRYRATSPVFGVNLPRDNIQSALPGFHQPLVADGYYLMVAPKPGSHVLHWHAKALPGPNATFTLDITYHITVR